MKSFYEFKMEIDVDDSQIVSVYSKAKISVELVNMYDKRILENISTIANLASGAYGLYNSGENRNVLPPEVENNLIIKTGGKLDKESLSTLKPEFFKQYFPNVDVNRIKPSDTVHVNVRRIMRENLNNDYSIIIIIASTIVHEAVHSIEYRERGRTDESKPKMEEQKFLNWVKNSKEAVSFIVQQVANFK